MRILSTSSSNNALTSTCHSYRKEYSVFLGKLNVIRKINIYSDKLTSSVLIVKYFKNTTLLPIGLGINGHLKKLIVTNFSRRRWFLANNRTISCFFSMLPFVNDLYFINSTKDFETSNRLTSKHVKKTPIFSSKFLAI